MTAKATKAEIAGRREKLCSVLLKNPKATLSDVLLIYPPVAFAREFDLNASSFGAKMENPGNIRVSEIVKIADGLGLPADRIFRLVEASMNSK